MRFPAAIVIIFLISCFRVSAQTCNSPVTEDMVVCAGSAAVLRAVADPGEIQWFDQASGGNPIATGSTFTTPVLNSTTTYYVQLVAGDCTSIRTPVSVYMRPGPNPGSTTICAGNTALLSVSGSGQSFEWFDSQDSETVIQTGTVFNTPVLNETATYYVRQIFADGCVSPRVSVSANVIQKPAPPIVSDITVCSGTSPTLTATGPGGFYQWFSAPIGGVAIITSPDFTTPPLTQSAIYYVQTNVSGCLSDRIPVRITVNPIPPLAEVTSQTVCAGSSSRLTATGPGGASFTWYDVPSRGIAVGTGAQFDTPIMTRTTTFYVETVLNGCSSGRQAVTVTVNPVPETPVSPDRTICRGNSVVLTAAGSSGIYQWFDQAAGGNLLGTGPQFTTPVITAGTVYYVGAVMGDCTSARTAVSLSVTSPPSAPQPVNTRICAGTAAVLTVADTLGTYEWYANQTGGNVLFTGDQFTTPNLSSDAVYYVQGLNGECASNRVPVQITVIPVPTAPVVSGQRVCPGQTASLAVSNPAGQVEWYDVHEGGTILSSGTVFTTSPISQETVFYVQNRTGDCVSPRTAVTVQVNTAPESAFRYLSGTYCRTAPNPRPQIFDPAGGTFSASPAGMVFVSTATGEINMTASANGSYLVTFTSNGPCRFSSSRPIRITDRPDPIFSLEGPYCPGSPNPLATYPTGGSGGTFTSSPAGLIFNSDFTIDITNSPPGTYIITNTIPSSGSSCASVSASDTIVILPATVVNAGADQIAYPSTPVNLSGSASGGSSVQWSGGQGTFTAPDSLNTIYTPALGEVDVSLSLRVSPSNGCPLAEDAVLISYRLETPRVRDTVICSGQTARLTASGMAENFRWYDALNGGNLLYTGVVFETPVLNTETSYFVEAYQGWNRSPRSQVRVQVNPVPASPAGDDVSVCRGAAASLNISGPGDQFEWYDAPSGGTLLGSGQQFSTPALDSSQTYYVQAVLNECVSPRSAITARVIPIPQITSRALEVVCNRSPLGYQITADQPGVNFIWRREAVAGISNPAVSGQTSSVINEILVSTMEQPVRVNYLITPFLNGCSGPEFTYSVTVDPSPVVTSASRDSICNNSASNYEVTFNLTGSDFSWSRQAVAGISNPAISGQRPAVIREVLSNTTNAPVNAVYRIDYSFDGCPGIPFDFTVTVNPVPSVSSPGSITLCNRVTQNYQITSDVPGTRFLWSRAENPNISNPAARDQNSNQITETLINTGSTPVTVIYTIVPTAFGCSGAAFEYRVTVLPSPATPLITGNRAVCRGSAISLGTVQVAGAAYAWTGPNGWMSSQRNNNILNAQEVNEGIYRLIVSVNGCPSDTATVNVRVNEPPTAQAGPLQTVCSLVSEVQLQGLIGGGTSSGIWRTSGSGSFLPSDTALNARYIPSSSDRSSGRVQLTLTSTSDDDCPPASSSMEITFETVPVISAGADQSVCSQNPLVNLSASVNVPAAVLWTSSGSGTFVPSEREVNAVYVPSSADIISGRVLITLRATGLNSCFPLEDQLTVNIIPPPEVEIGPNIYLPLNRNFTLNPQVNYSDVSYQWLPPTYLSDALIRNPVAHGVEDITYTLRVTDSRGCVTEDQVFIDVLMPLTIPNTFTPNGDGVNDVWNIAELASYPGNTVQVFNRYGEKVFSSVGYEQPWNGTHRGEPAPVGTYYYIIDAQFSGMVYSGYITLLR